MTGLSLQGEDAEGILAEILEYLEAREGNSLKDSLAPKPEGGPDVAALLGSEPGEPAAAPGVAEPCPACGKSPCECPKGA